jgi:hypothetical protein
MTLDELLLEWSYRSEKGYPSLDNPSDISILKQILEQLELPSNTVIKSLKEASLNPGELKKDRIGNIKEPGIRVQLFLDKIERGDEFEMIDGTKLTINKEKSQDAIERLEQYLVSYQDNLSGLVFYDDNETPHDLKSFKKTEEFGSSKGAGGGSDETRLQETAHAYGCAIGYYVNNDSITSEDLNQENFEQAAPHVDADASTEEVINFLNEKPQWSDSIVKSVNSIIKTFPNNNFKVHRGSEQVQRIYNSWSKVAKKEGDLKMGDDKWNPADIWLISNDLIDHDWSGNLEVLNGQISNFYADNKLIGISLKQIPKNREPKIVVQNDPEIPKENIYKFNDFDASIKSSNIEIKYIDSSKEENSDENAGTLMLKNFNVDSGWCAEISGKAARGGKACHGGINDILKLNKIDLLPTSKDVKTAFQTDDEDYYNKFYYLFDRFLENISKEDFKQLYDKSELSWRTAKYMGLEFLEKIYNNTELADEIINDIMRYAASSTKASSQHIKFY